MNCIPNQPTGSRSQGARGFTLIEMIGVLAVIAILAALLIPKVFSAISDARINSVCINTDTIKTAVADHYGKYGKFDYIYGTNQVTLPAVGYDTNVLMAEGLIDKPYVAKIAGGDPSATSGIQLVSGADANGGTGYILGGTNNATASAGFVVEAHLQKVAVQDAKDLNDRIDGVAMGAPDLTTGDTKGRVEYGSPTAGVVDDLYIYITSR